MTKVSHFKVGLFFIGSLLLGIGAMVWIGAAGFFQSTQIYATFFNSSVDGLGIGSDVQYLGLGVGKVTDVSLVPDRKLVMVLMEIDSGFEINGSMAVQLKLAGITGKKYLNIMEPAKDAETFMPEKKNLDVEHPVIPSAPGQLAKMGDALEKVYEKVQTIDFGEMIAQWKKVAENANSVLSSKQIDKILADLTEVSDRLENVTGSLEKPGAAERFDQTFNDLSAAAQSSRSASESIEQQLAKIPSGSLADISKQANATMNRIEKTATSTDQQLDEALTLFRQTLRQTNQVLLEFQMLARSLRREPGRILTQPEEKEPFER